MSAGWHLLKGERFSGLVCQNYFMYRAVGVLYDAKKFHLQARKSSERGIWVRLQHIETSKSVWIGSLRLPNNETREGCRRLVSQFMGELPSSTTGIVLGDYNTHFRWATVEGVCIPSIISSKWSDLRRSMAENGFKQQPPPPHQADTPTFHFRKRDVTNTQIDGVFTRGLEGYMNICEGSRVEVGTGHDRVTQGPKVVCEGGRTNEGCPHPLSCYGCFA